MLAADFFGEEGLDHLLDGNVVGASLGVDHLPHHFNDSPGVYDVLVVVRWTEIIILLLQGLEESRQLESDGAGLLGIHHPLILSRPLILHDKPAQTHRKLLHYRFTF